MISLCKFNFVSALSLTNYYLGYMVKLIIISILSYIVLTGFNLINTPIHFSGHLSKNDKYPYTYMEGLAIIVKSNDETLASTITNSNGDFELEFKHEKQNSYDFFCHGVTIDTLYIGSVNVSGLNTIHMNFEIPSNPKRNILGQVLCPKCKKANKVYKIRYGDGLPILRTISNMGDTTYSNIYKGYYNAGTCLTDIAKHYCDRDKIKF